MEITKSRENGEHLVSSRLLLFDSGPLRDIYIYIRIHILKFLIQKYPAKIMDGSSIKRELKYILRISFKPYP